MCSALGGRAAEEVIFNKISTGALSDLEKVTKQAYAMVSIYGLNKRVGNISYYDSQGRDMFTKPYSEDTAKVIDEEVSKMIEFQYARAIQILTENKDKLDQLANKLLTAEVIFKEDLENIFGKRIWDKEERLPESTIVSDSIAEIELNPNTEIGTDNDAKTEADSPNLEIETDNKKDEEGENLDSETKE
jgi:cell division protease FtsH